MAPEHRTLAREVAAMMDPQISEKSHYARVDSPDGKVWIPLEYRDKDQVIHEEREGYGARFSDPTSMDATHWDVSDSLSECVEYLYDRLGPEEDEMEEKIHGLVDRLLDDTEFRVDDASMTPAEEDVREHYFGDVDAYLVVRDKDNGPYIREVHLSPVKARIDAVVQAERVPEEYGGLKP